MIQVENAKSIIPNGFSSGPKSSPTGSFSYQFNKPGIYHYWSGYVEQTGQISFRGVIIVNDSIDKQFEVSLKLNDFEAQKCHFPFTYNQIEYDKCIDIDFGYNWCSPTQNYSGQIIKCDPISTTRIDDNFLIDFSSIPISNMLFTANQADLPVINNISCDNNAFNSEINITGSMFSLTDFKNQVLIGGVNCPIINNTSNEIICKLNENSGLQPNIEYKIEVLINNLGYAIQNGTFLINFDSIIQSVSPSSGSILGGTTINIIGIGFNKSNTFIQIGSNVYYHDEINTNITYNSIVLNTKEQEEANYPILINTNGVQSICSAQNCNFTFSEMFTPIIDDIWPENIDSQTVLTLNGLNFGSDLNKININIGKQVCTPISLIDTEIKCQLDGCNLGKQIIDLSVIGFGNAKNSKNLNINGLPLIKSTTPNSGSLHGGTIVTISGNGFDETTQVLLNKTNCTLIDYSINMLTCQTNAHLESIVSFEIK